MTEDNVATHPRDLRFNIWRGVLSATIQEIHDGMTFYHSAHGLCALIACAFQTSIEQVAGVYAALSPLNVWYQNVANIIDVFRRSQSPRSYALKVNTTNANRDKAIRIAAGEDPLCVLVGKKVRSFYLSIANPDDRSHIPVDRHLICLALGVKITDNQVLRSYASDKKLYAKIHGAYSLLGEKEGIGNRLASIAWFVQRRVDAGQSIMPQDGKYLCCGRVRVSHGEKRLRCQICGTTIARDRYRTWDHRETLDGFKISTLKSNGRRIINLGKSHSWANKGGWQYLSRYLVMKDLDRKLLTDEHVHHKDNDKLHDDKSNYQLLLAESHGRHHAYVADLAGYRGSDGRFVEHVEPIAIGAGY